MGSAVSFEDLCQSARFLRQIPSFVRHPVSVEEARAKLYSRLDRREADSLALADRAIYRQPESPYRALLRGSPAKSMGTQGGNQSCLGHRAVGELRAREFEAATNLNSFRAVAPRAACCSARSRTKGSLAVLDCLEEQGVRGFVAQGRIVIELPDDLAADEPQVVEVASKRPGGESFVLKVRQETLQSSHEAAADGLVLVGARPALGPAFHEGDHVLG